MEENEWYGEEPDHSLPQARTSHGLFRIQPSTPGKTNHHHQESQAKIGKGRAKNIWLTQIQATNSLVLRTSCLAR
jgi:hypothetical protein